VYQGGEKEMTLTVLYRGKPLKPYDRATAKRGEVYYKHVLIREINIVNSWGKPKYVNRKQVEIK
jgi:hypothetical protein